MNERVDVGDNIYSRNDVNYSSLIIFEILNCKKYLGFIFIFIFFENLEKKEHLILLER